MGDDQNTVRTFIEALSICVLNVDLEGRITFMNRRFCDTASVVLSGVLGCDAVEKLVAERDRHAARRAMEEVIAGRVIEELDLTVTTGRVLSFNGALMLDSDGHPRGMVWVAIDVTETRRRMEEVRRGEERTQRSLQQLKEFSRVSSMILQEKNLDRVCKLFVDAIREVSTFNRVILTLCDDELYGYQWYFAGLSEEEIAIFHQNKLTSRERVTIFQERFRLGNSYFIPHDEGWYYEGVRSNKESIAMVDWHPDDFLFIPLFGTNRKIVGIVSVDDPADGRCPSAESISPLELFANQVAHAIEEKKLDQEVKKTTIRYRTLIETMNDGLFSVDLGEEITFTNPALTKLTGYREAEMVGRPLSFLLLPESFEEFRRHSRASTAGQGSRFEVALSAKDAAPIPVLMSATPYLQNGAMVGSFAIVSDLREQKQAEEERRRMHEEVLEANVKLRDSMKQLQAAQEQLIQAEKLSALGQLVSGVAHELNSPLMGIRGYSHLLLGSDPPETMKRNLERIDKEAERCRKIVQSLLDFARTTKAERSLIDVNEVLRTTIDLRHYQLKIDNIELVIELAAELPLVLADSHQIQQVFVNIINNAQQAIMETTRRGRLTISTKAKGESVHIEFIDNGPGIPEDKIGKIFDPFFTTKGVGKGTGLGLSLSYGIIHEHDGRIFVESKPGDGATFVVELPARSSRLSAGRSLTLPVTPQVLNGSRVLIVDDEEMIRELLREALLELGCQVETAQDGRDGLKRLASSKYDVMLLDIKMPNMDGLSLYEHVQRLFPQYKTRVVFLTGDLMTPTTQARLDQTECPYVKKPASIDEVVAALASVVARGRAE